VAHAPPIVVLVASVALSACATGAACGDPIDGCIRPKITDAYDAGWRLRTTVKHDLAPGEMQSVRLSTYLGSTYRLSACGDEGFSDLDLLLYDADGALIGRDGTRSREPVLDYTPAAAGTVTIGIFAAAMPTRLSGATALAVLVR